ncbi:HAMP domain-containing histidine kinase [bacterium]|nr:HAMP domain-containing histidine kinase [bacterium]
MESDTFPRAAADVGESGALASETWLRALGEGLTEHGVIVYDSSGRAVLANTAARRILARPVPVSVAFEVHAGALGLEGDGGQPLPLHDHPAALALRGVETRSQQAFVRRSAGGPRAALLVDAFPTRASGGQVQGAFLVLRDLEEVERAQVFRETFLARAGHELRTVLAALVTATQVLERRAKKRGDPKDRALEIVVESVSGLRKLIEDLLDLSRIGRGMLELKRARVPLGPILRAAAEDARRDHPDATVEAEVPGDVVTGNWDPDRLRQMVRALVENGIVHGRPPVQLRIASLEKDGVAILVRDHGDGVPPERRDEVLKPFVRRDRDVGLGLGLSIASEIARAHGGRLSLGDPDGGTGCAVTAEIPLAVEG